MNDSEIAQEIASITTHLNLIRDELEDRRIKIIQEKKAIKRLK